MARNHVTERDSGRSSGRRQIESSNVVKGKERRDIRVRDRSRSLRETEDRHRRGDRHSHWVSGGNDDDTDLRYGRKKEKDERRKDGISLKETDNTDARSIEASKMPKPTVLLGDSNTDECDSGRVGGVYMPPFKLARMMKDVRDKSSIEYQRITWDALRKSITGLVNRVNATNIRNIIPELFSEDLIRGRGLFCRSCMKFQMASPGFTDVLAALVAVVNSKFPVVGRLLLRRVVLKMKRAYKRNDKPRFVAAAKFIAHLVNQNVASWVIALELLTLLLEKPEEDSLEVAVQFVMECGSFLQDVSPRGLDAAFASFREILHDGEIDNRIQYLIEGLLALRKGKFQGYPAVRPELDLVEQKDQVTHNISLLESIEPEITLDFFRPHPNFLEHEQKFENLRKRILGEESDDEVGYDAASNDDEDDEEDSDSKEEDDRQMKIKDETETNIVNLRRTIYLIIMSSVNFEEAGHKLLQVKLEPGQEIELCTMLLECCSQEKTYLRYYGLLGQRFCAISKAYQDCFETCFVQQYSMVHRLETSKLHNVAKLFAHLIGTDALPWRILAYIRLTEEDTTSSSRIFIKTLFQELSENLGIQTLNERLSDPAMEDSFESLLPKDKLENTRFSINFFTAIGLGGITGNLREYLKSMRQRIMQEQKSQSESNTELELDDFEKDARWKRGRERDSRHGKGSRGSDRDQKRIKRSRIC